MTDNKEPDPEKAHDALRTALRDLGNGPVWHWCNDTACPDSTTDAYMEAVAALETLRRHILEDARQAYAASL